MVKKDSYERKNSNERKTRSVNIQAGISFGDETDEPHSKANHGYSKSIPSPSVPLAGMGLMIHQRSSSDIEMDDMLHASYNLAFEKKRCTNELIPTMFDVNEDLQINSASNNPSFNPFFGASKEFRSVAERLMYTPQHEYMTWLPACPGHYVKDHLTYPTFLRLGIIDHRSQFFYYWNISSFLTNVLNAIIIPLWSGFYYAEDGNVVTGAYPEIFFFAYLVCSTVQMFLDFVIRCNLTYYATGGRIVCNRRAIVRNYLKSWFVVDLIAGLPYQMFIINQPNPPHYGYFELLRLIKFFRVLTTDIAFSSLVLQRFMLVTGIRINMMRVALVRSLLLLVIVIHIFACGAYVASKYIGLESPWESPVQNRDTISEKYFEAFYWATMTSTTTGFGDLTINTTELQVYATFVMLGGAVMWSSIIAVMTNFLRVSSIQRHAAEKLSDGLSEFVSMIHGADGARQNLMIHLKRVSEYPSISLSSIHQMLGDLSPSMRAWLLLRLHAFWLTELPCFYAVDDPWYIWHLSHALQAVRYHPDEYLAAHGCRIRRMTIVHIGCCIAQRKGCLMANCIIGKDMILSEPRTYSDNYRVLIMVEAWTLGESELNDLMVKFPELKKLVRKAALRLAFRLNIRKVIYRELIPCNLNIPR